MCKKILLMVFILVGLNCYAQRGGLDNINQTNSKGQKDGYWIEQLKYGRYELYYRNGLKSGNFKSYSSKGVLDAFGEFINGEYAGTWYYFDEKTGQLESINKDFSRYKHQFNDTNPRGITGSTNYKCYNIGYYPSGVVKEEGVILWDESPESDTSYEYGLWKYYDESGKLIKTKDFK